MFQRRAPVLKWKTERLEVFGVRNCCSGAAAGMVSDVASATDELGVGRTRRRTNSASDELGVGRTQRRTNSASDELGVDNGRTDHSETRDSELPVFQSSTSNQLWCVHDALLVSWADAP